MGSSDALDGSRLRVRDGAGRAEWIASSFLGTVLGGIAAGLLWAISNVVSGALCVGEECQLGWLLLGGLLSVLVGMFAGMLLVGLGWAWWAVLAAVVVSTPLWIPLPPLVVTAVLLVAVPPVLAGLAGHWAQRGPVWRTWLLLGIAGALLVATAGFVLVLP